MGPIFEGTKSMLLQVSVSPVYVAKVKEMFPDRTFSAWVRAQIDAEWERRQKEQDGSSTVCHRVHVADSAVR